MDPPRSKMQTSETSEEVHTLYDKWTLWAHLPHDTDWSLKSYKKIMEVSTVEDIIRLYRGIPEKMIKNCMLFVMRSGISPTWEDPKNRNGGCFSFKVTNKNVYQIWRNLSFMLVGETLSNNKQLLKNINGITISPKRSFCIVKVWTATCLHQEPSMLDNIPEINLHGCIFKRHNPEY